MDCADLHLVLAVTQAEQQVAGVEVVDLHDSSVVAEGHVLVWSPQSSLLLGHFDTVGDCGALDLPLDGA